MVVTKMQVRFMLLVVAVSVATKIEAWDEFTKAAEEVKNLSSQLTDAETLKVYSLFKQAKIGDVNTDRPGFLDVKGKAKWDAWNALKGITKEKAAVAYVHLVERLIEKYKV